MMEGIKVGIDEDMGDGMQCSEHPLRNNPGGICAFCLQDKLGKLVSSPSFPVVNPLRASPSSSPSPSFRSEVSTGISNVTTSVSVGSFTSTSSMSLALHRPAPGKVKREGNAGGGGGGGYIRHYQDYQYSRRARIPFLLAKKKKKMLTAAASSSTTTTFDRDVVFKRSKSTTTAPARRATGGHFMDGGQDFSPRRRGFWSFLYLSSSSSSSKPDTNKVPSFSPASTRGASNLSRRDVEGGGARDVVVAEDVDEADDDVSPNTAASASSFGRKVSRSRSVGCGSRSFSGDFFERISTGFGDCTLRRVESQREGKPKSTTTAGSHIKERVRCGGIFGGFIITSSSSSSSSTSYWEMNGKPNHPQPAAHGGRGRSSWAWAFASPIRAFSKPAVSSKDGKRDRDHHVNGNGKSPTPNLAAIPTLLSIRG